jgi:hypothetical protein
MPRFVLLAHDHPHQHWDLMLEAGAALRTWRLDHPLQLGQALRAERIGDHRLAYLDYEGPVSGGRGSVSRCHAGAFTWLSDEPGRVRVYLKGERLEGILELSQVEEGPWWHGGFTTEEKPASG